MNSFFRGLLVLSLAAFVGECLELFINVVLARELGDEAFGMYMAILPTMLFVVVLANMELPVSISKLIAEQEPNYHWSVLIHALKLATVCAATVMLLAVWILPMLPVFDDYHTGIQWLMILLVPVISFSAVVKGYLIGAQKTGMIAIANVLKRTCQLLGLLFVFSFFSWESDTAIFMALLALKLSELLVLTYLITVFIINMRRIKKAKSSTMPWAEARKKLLAVSVPTTGLRVFHSATFAIKPFLITWALGNAGMIESIALVEYGKLAGIAFTIGFFPAFIAHALLIVLIPIVADSYEKKDFRTLHHYLKLSILVTIVYGAPVILAFYAFSDTITNLFFEESTASAYLTILVPYFLFHYFAIPLQAYLIGIGLVRDAFIHSLYSTIISFILMLYLGSLPSLQMDGIILGMNMGAVLLTLMHYVTICEKLGLNVMLGRKNGALPS
ncbi:oligosaccharide flippase family protein [Geomicrobium sp. JSM 1781026]|uniref:oligosaccharide flippase family protein n=1 Tax=Geomicrobium sp. JSM 1781026 TaxID=3344580 RepID=UPI0035BF480F